MEMPYTKSMKIVWNIWKKRGAEEIFREETAGSTAGSARAGKAGPPRPDSDSQAIPADKYLRHRLRNCADGVFFVMYLPHKKLSVDDRIHAL